MNQLIELVATAQPLPPDPDEDLMFRPVNAATKKFGASQPLPPARAPSGTQQNLHTIKQVPPGVRITTPSRSMTIPPLTLDDHDEDAEVTNPGPSTFSRPTTQAFAAQPPAPRATGSNVARLSSEHGVPPDPIATRATRPTLPPPVPTIRASSPPPVPALPTLRQSLQSTSSFSYPLVPTPESHHATSMPIVAPPTLDDDPIASLLEPRLSESAHASASWLEAEIGTQQVPKTDWKTIAGKLIGPMVVLVIAGIFIGGYFAFDGDGGKKRAPKAEEKIAMPASSEGANLADLAPTPTEKADELTPDVATEAKAEPAAVPAPITPPNLAATEPPKASEKSVEPPKAEPASMGRPTLVDVRIDSNPAGATVMLIDRGKQTFLGTTPMSAAVDVAKKYELVFSYEGRATVVESLDPSSQKKLSVKLSRTRTGSGAVAAAPAVVAPKPVAPKVIAPKIEKPAAVEKPAVDEKPAAEKPAAALGGEGTLMISSKPPCEIFVDGKPTGLTTPQRAIMLPAGAHKVTLVNTAEGIKKTVSVQITADKPTKVIQDFMK
ncbi:MAG: PEGA domain-containing protein [Myxococcota bacterium]|nr:PEGA domain-containing protein [Deltaproteobacteria bacterium]MDQ3334854.1 PEGA domain-containing protein [Myxococcota bacterium]